MRVIFVTVLLYLLGATYVAADPGRADDKGRMELLDYAELSTLYETKITAELRGKLTRILTVPQVHNLPATTQEMAVSPRIGEFIRVAHWNIERGLEFDALAAALKGDEKTIAQMLDTTRFPIGSAKRREMLEQLEQLRSADIIVLNEVDWGMKRSGYRDVAAELASILGMSYAFGAEFIELTPVYLNREYPDSAPLAKEISGLANLDTLRYKGLHGTAILSRFPLENVRLIPFKYQPYDWFESEKSGVTLVEKARRRMVEAVFLEKALTEVRRGGRTMLMADIVDERIPSGRATIVATHLESRTSPRNRQTQLRELLETIKDIRHPVVVTGDMNTSTNDMTPTSIQRELKKHFGSVEGWAKRGINYLLGLGLIQDAASASLTFGRNHGDPTVRHIPFVMPNDERKFFSILKDFRFADGGTFDFRGEAERSSNGKRNTLANSNERDAKGFVTTFRLERPVIFLGRYKLDWIFVKPAMLRDPSDYNGSYVFAPHFGRTLGAVNSLGPNRISDHSPMIVDLPLGEPRIERKKKG